MTQLSEIKRYIDSFARPNGYNNYSWDITKRLAMEVWECHLLNRPCRRNLNYLCKEFYQMIRKPDGEYIVPRQSFRTF